MYILHNSVSHILREIVVNLIDILFMSISTIQSGTTKTLKKHKLLVKHHDMMIPLFLYFDS